VGVLAEKKLLQGWTGILVQLIMRMRDQSDAG
jgi:hypothetical protein